MGKGQPRDSPTPVDPSAPEEGRGEVRGEGRGEVRREDGPLFLELLLGNGKVLGVAALIALLSWALWLLLAKLFPDVSWLRPGV